MRVLALDTASDVCGIALIVEGRLKAEILLQAGRTHARVLMQGVNAALGLSGMRLDEMDGFAVTIGPGSFTGLRIGISTAKGLALATGKPLAGISSLAILAEQAAGCGELICPMLDARRGQVYWSLSRFEGDRAKVIMPERVDEPRAVLGHIHQPCIFVGSGALLYRTCIEKERRIKDDIWMPPEQHALRPGVLARLGWRALIDGPTQNLQELKPVYIRPSDAEQGRSL